MSTALELELQLAEAELELLEMGQQSDGQTRAPIEQQDTPSTPNPAPTFGGETRDSDGYLINQHEVSGKDVFLNAATLGLADEVGAGVQAGLDKLTNWDGPSSFGERYDTRLREQQEGFAKYRAANPKTDVALNLAGGAFSGGASLANIPKLKELSLLPRALLGLGVASGEGALVGAASAPTGERMEGAKSGAVWGPAAKVVTGGLGQVFKGARTSIPDLGKGETFRPLNEAAPETFIGGFYRDHFGRSIGGGAIRQQTQKVIDRADKAVRDSDAKYHQNLFDTSTPASMKGTPVDISDPQVAFANLKKRWVEDGFNSVKNRDFKINDKDLINSVKTKVDDPALEEYTPALVKALNHKVGNKMERDSISPTGPKYRGKGVGVEKVPNTAADTGRIQGADLMEARNSFRIKANALSDTGEDALKKASLSAAAREIDEIIKKQLADTDPAALKAFEDELANYGRFTQLTKAMVKAGKSEADLPTPKQVASTFGTGNKVASGVAPHQSLTKTELKVNAELAEVAKKAKMAMPARTGGVQQAATAALTGHTVTPANASLGYKAAVGAAIAKQAGLEGTQRAIAGQLLGQKELEAALRNSTLGASRANAAYDYQEQR